MASSHIFGGPRPWEREENPWLETIRAVPLSMPTEWDTTDRVCRLSELPQEMILNIKKFLPHESKVALSITCKKLMDMSDEDFRSHRQLLPLLVRDIPDGVLCLSCNVIHRPTGIVSKCRIDREYATAPCCQLQPDLPTPHYQLTRLLAKTIAIGPTRKKYIREILAQMSTHSFKETRPWQVSTSGSRTSWTGLLPRILTPPIRTMQIEKTTTAKVVNSRLLTKTQTILYPNMVCRAWSNITTGTPYPQWWWNHDGRAWQALNRNITLEALRLTKFTPISIRELFESNGYGMLREDSGPTLNNSPWLGTPPWGEVLQIDSTCINVCKNAVKLPGLGTGIAITVWRDHGGFGAENAWRWWRHLTILGDSLLGPSFLMDRTRPQWSYDDVNVATRFEGHLETKMGVGKSRQRTYYSPQIKMSDFAKIQEGHNSLSWFERRRGDAWWYLDTIMGYAFNFHQWTCERASARAQRNHSADQVRQGRHM